jgi:MFS family permease
MSSHTTSKTEHLFEPPTEPVGRRFIWALVLAQFFFFIALLGPAIIGIGIKVQSLVPDDQKASALGLVAGLGALAAAVGNVVFGRFSDRTTSRWGRRRPWIVGGTVVMALGLALLAVSNSVPVAAFAWFLAQLGANAAYAPFVATLADQVPQSQRGIVSAALGIAFNVGILGGVYVAQFFADQLLVMFVAPAIVAIVAMLLFAVVLPDRILPTRPPAMTLKEWGQTFWVSPRKHPDFALAWISRFMIVLATFLFTTFRFFYLQDQVGISEDDAPAAVSTGVLIYTITLVASGYLAGWLSDKLGRRKVFVIGSAALFGAGTALLTVPNSLTAFYLIEALLGIAFGIYIAVDLALVIDVLPNPDDSGKDLGVFNLASAVPQSLAPVVGAVLLSIGSPDNQNYSLLLSVAGVVSVIGALVILPIKTVR